MPTGTWPWSVVRMLLALGALLMVVASSSYLDLGREHPFFLEKLPLARPEPYLWALWTHVPSALFALPACLLLDLDALRTRWPRTHRVLGRATALCVLLLVTPSGLYLAQFAQGGFVTTLGFWLTGGISALAMVRAVLAARARSFQRHRRWARHVTAQLSVAVISRALLAGAELCELYEPWLYVAALWLPVLGAALGVELAHAPRVSPKKGPRHETLAPVGRVDVVR